MALAATDVSAVQANATLAGGDIYQLWGAYGIATNSLFTPSLPLAGPGAVDRNGLWAVGTTYATGSGISVYAANGTVLQQINETTRVATDGRGGSIRLQGGYLTYGTDTGWPVVTALTVRPVEGYVKQQQTTGLIPVNANGSLVVVEWNGGASQWTIRNGDSGVGLIVNTAPVAGSPTLTYGMDAIYLNGLIRLAWSTGAGEAPSELVILDVDTATKTTSRGTVVGGSVVFTDGPELQGSRFLLAQAGIVYPPYKDAMNGGNGRIISQPWLRYLEGQSSSVAAMQTAANSVTPPGPAIGGDAEVALSVPAVAFPVGRVLTDSVTATWDRSAPFQLKVNVVGGVSTLGYWSELTNGDLVAAELIFANGDTLDVWVPTP